MNAAAQSAKLILLVDDTRECCAALEVALTARGLFTVLACSSAEEALELTGTRPPSAVVTDIHLPGISGLELIHALRVRYAASFPVIVAVSGDGDPALRTAAIAAGADAFFPKPYSPAEICRTLEELIHDD